MFEGPKLRQAFSSGSGGKPPRPEEPPGLMDVFRAKVVAIQGPVICKQLSAALKTLLEEHTEKGVAKDVRTHFALQAISTNVTNMREAIERGGAAGYKKMKEASTYVSRLQKLGLDA